MNFDRVDATIANAILYEGYILYPYRPSSIKNRQRWTFGGVFRASARPAEGGDRVRSADPMPCSQEVGGCDRGACPLSASRRCARSASSTAPCADLAPTPEAVGDKVARWRPQATDVCRGKKRSNAKLSSPRCRARNCAARTRCRSPSASRKERARAGRATPAWSPACHPHAAAALRGSIAITADEVARRRLSAHGADRERHALAGSGSSGAATRRNAAPSPRPTRSWACAMARFSPCSIRPTDCARLAAACDNQGHLAGAGRAVGRDATRCLSSPIILYDYPADRPGKPRRPVRRDRDRRNPDPAHPGDDRCRKARDGRASTAAPAPCSNGPRP